MATYLVTGCAGFIGAAVTQLLCNQGHRVVGVDNLNDYYEVSLKEARLSNVAHPSFTFLKEDVSDADAINRLFQENAFDTVVHLAAQAGVRYSLENPGAYTSSNLVGFSNVLEACRHNGMPRLVYASSSSIYGDESPQPFLETQQVDRPVSFYAATKKANELMAHSYSHLYNLETVGLRFFTVYGPWGRPDMAPMLFASAISSGKPINVFNQGNCRRDFTYIDDIAEGVIRSCQFAMPDDRKPYALFNIGRGQPVDLMEFIETLESLIGSKAKKNMLPAQPGDVEETWASIDALQAATGYTPETSLAQGLEKFILWYKEYYRVG